MLLSGDNSFSGGLLAGEGTIHATHGGALGSGTIAMHGGGLVVGTSAASTTIGNPVVIGADSPGGSIAASTFSTVTLDLPVLRLLNPAGKLTLGGDLESTLVLSINAFNYTPGAGLVILAETCLLGDLHNAQNALRVAGTGQVELEAGARINNLDFNGGKLMSGNGPLNASVVYTNVQLNIGTIDGTAGADTVTFRLASGTSFNLSGVTFFNWTDGTDTITIIGSALGDSPGGSAQADDIRGGDGADFLSSGADNDRLDGGLGVDSMAGRTGNDTYIVDNIGDTPFEDDPEGDDGIDTVIASIDYNLPEYLENLALRGPDRQRQ